jgi:hypothetical protein
VYMSRLFQKLDVKDRFELALFGLKNLAPGHNMPGPTPVNSTPMWQAPRAFFVERIPVQSVTALRPRQIAYR